MSSSLLGDLPPFPRSVGIRTLEDLRRALFASVCIEAEWETVSLRELTLRYGATAKKLGSTLFAELEALQAAEQLVVFRVEPAKKTYVFAVEKWRFLQEEFRTNKSDWDKVGLWLKQYVK